jgi:hypothetical protein
MAIIKPNNNTISAITALPNGIVSSDALASGVGGKVLQVVTNATNGTTQTSSTSFVDTSLTANITPSSTSNKILILVSANCEANNTTAYVTVARGGTNIGSSGGFAITQVANSSIPAHHSYYDSPSSTSSLTYTVQIRNNDGGNTMTFNSQNPKSSITLMEIAG